MIEYTEFEKEKIGKLFKYTRKKNHVKWDDIKSKNISSPTTYSKLEKGEILKDDTYYDEYIEFYHLKYERIDDFEEWLRSYLPRLNHALEYNIKNDIQSLYDEIRNKLASYSHILIYEQYLKGFEYIFKYYIDNQYLTLEEIHDGMLLIDIAFYDEIIEVYLLEVIYISENNSIGDHELALYLGEIAEKYESRVLDYVKAMDKTKRCSFNQALIILSDLYQYYKDLKNDYREFKCILGIFNIQKNIDFDEADKTIPMLMEYKKIDSFPDNLKRSINYNIGIYYYLNKKYKNAYSLFYENVVKYNQVKDIAFLGSICTHINIKIPKEIKTIDFMTNCDKLYVNYYKMKMENNDNDNLVNYIMNRILKEKLIYIPYVLPYWRMFEYELLEMMKTNKKYCNAYLKYREKMDKICKDA